MNDIKYFIFGEKNTSFNWKNKDITKYNLIKEILKKCGKSGFIKYNDKILMVYEEEIEKYKKLNIKDLDEFFTLKFPIENEIYDKNGDFQKLKILSKYKDFDLIFREEYNNHEYFKGLKYMAYQNEVPKISIWNSKVYNEEVKQKMLNFMKRFNFQIIQLKIYNSPLEWFLPKNEEIVIEESYI